MILLKHWYFVFHFPVRLFSVVLSFRVRYNDCVKLSCLYLLLSSFLYLIDIISFRVGKMIQRAFVICKRCSGNVGVNFRVLVAFVTQ